MQGRYRRKNKSARLRHQCIPKILAGEDVIGCSKTGTGKTLAFALPVIQKLSEDPFGVFALVLTPTRELAFQIADQFQVLGAPIGLRHVVVVGGRDVVEQGADLFRKPHVVIATPGRLADHITSTPDFNLFDKLQMLVIDEADRLLDGQYGEQLKTILGVVPKKRQTLLFSATITDALGRLSSLSVKKPFLFQGVVPKKRQTLLFSATVTDALGRLSSLSVKKPFLFQGVVPKKRQTLLFSATVTDALGRLSSLSVKKPFLFQGVVPKKRQTLLFSATVTDALGRLSSLSVKKPFLFQGVVPKKRQTLLFSATITDALGRLSSLSVKKPFLFQGVVPKKRQTLLFSATVTDALGRLSSLSVKKPFLFQGVVPKKRQTLLFSATITDALGRLSSLSVKKPFLFQGVVPKKRQTLLFSATVTDALGRLSSLSVKKPFLFQGVVPKKRQTLLFSATITDALGRLSSLSVKKPFLFQGVVPKKRQTLLFSATITDALGRLSSLSVKKPFLFQGVVPKKRQTLLFSATITDALGRLSSLSVKKPFLFQQEESETEEATVAGLEQRFVLCPVDVKDAYLVYVVAQFARRQPNSSILVFTHTCREAQALALMFKELGFPVGSLHSAIPQRERMGSLAKFRSNRIKLLIATDVAARGLDIPSVDLVVNHNVPRVPKEYVHRVGRAARAGRQGAAITFVTQYDLALIQAVEKLIGKELQELKVSGKKVSVHVTEVLVAKREAEVRLDAEGFGEKKEVNRRKQMILEGMDPDKVDSLMRQHKEKRSPIFHLRLRGEEGGEQAEADDPGRHGP